MNQYVLLEKKDHLAIITLNRPEKRNALNQIFMTALLQTIKSLSTDASVRVVIMKGQGDHFCAGADIQQMQQMAAGAYEDNLQDAELLAEVMLQLSQLPKPTIALVHGATIGGGMGLLCACDIAIAEQQASFGFSEVKIGMAPCVISPYVVRAIGERMARYYFLTGERFSTDVAERIGLVHQIAPAGDLIKTGMTMANLLLHNGPNALAAAKKIIRDVANKEVTPTLVKMTAKGLADLRLSAEGQEGLKAFIEKREPEWS